MGLTSGNFGEDESRSSGMPMEGNTLSNSWENYRGGCAGHAKVLWRGRAYEEKGVISVSGSGYSHEEKKEENRKILGGES